MKRIFAAITFAAGCGLPGIIFADFFVAPNGSDCAPPACGTQSAPFRTIDYARQAIRNSNANANMSGNITVYVRGGRYELSNTVAFDQGDSGSNGFSVIYSAYPGDPPAVISGGRRITGWSPASNGIYKASAGSLNFRQLYVNDQRAVRARTPNQGNFFWTQSWDSTSQLIAIDSSTISNWAQFNQVEMVVDAFWTSAHLRLGSFSVSGNTANVTVQDPERTQVFSHYVKWGLVGTNPFFFENALEFLDSPGEWYLNTQTGELFYMPRQGEDMSTAEVVAPAVETLLSIQGTLDAPVHHLAFVGLTFAHSNWLLPSSEGLVTTQAMSIACSSCLGSAVPPAVSVENANHLRFERDVFKEMGASGLGFWSGTQDDSITGNVLRDIAGTALAVDIMAQKNPADSRQISQRELIQDNYILRAAQDYRGNVGMFFGFPNSANILHNEITDMPYTGISLGFSWDTSGTPAGNNLVSANRIHNVMNGLADGGGFYHLGAEPGTVIQENYFYDVNRSPTAMYSAVAGIYLDNGSSQLTVKNNAIDNIAGPSGAGPYDAPLYLQMFGLPAADNTIVNFSWPVGGSASGNTFINDGTLDLTAVKANAGIEPAYADILSGGTPTGTTPPAPPRGLKLS